MIKNYIVITDKRKELPWAVLDSTKEAAKWLGITRDGVCKAIRREAIVWEQYRVFRVEKICE